MKLKDITECSGRWSTPLGTLEAHPAVADGILVDLSLWGTSIMVSRWNAKTEDISARSEHRVTCTTKFLNF